MSLFIVLIGWLNLLRSPPAAVAGDWPQILGPARNGTAENESLIDPLPDAPEITWTQPVGQGYAGPAVVDGKVLMFHRIDGHERLEAFEASSGGSLYQQDFVASYQGGINPDVGPRCVPVVHDNTVILFGAAGTVHAVQLSDGKPLWSRELYTELDGREGYFGAGSTPIVVGDRVLINVGGRRQAGIVALDLQSGKTQWQKTDEAASYSSPAVIQIEGQSLALFVTRLNAILIDSQTGRVVAARPFGRRGPTVNAATPLVVGGRAFLTASYGVGATLLELPTLKSVWENDRTLSSQYNTPVYRDGYLYGIHGREDLGMAELRCVEFETGRVAWAEPQFGVSHLLRAGDRLLAVKIDGELELIAASPAAFRSLGRQTLPLRTTRALPALSNGHVFLRDESKLMAVKVGKS